MPGKFLGMPYDWRRPTKERLSPTPGTRTAKVYAADLGWGYGLNFGRSGSA